jgi:hypothetical protein
MNSLWVKYESICTNCDSLFEITSMNPLINEPQCTCSNPHIIRINRYDVTDITEPEVDIVSTCPYN